jgi:ABC-type uncharacterized transport system permease subunit
MVKILIEGCTATVTGGLTPAEITTALGTVAVAIFLSMTQHVKKNKDLLVGILLAVLVLSGLLGLLSRSCDDEIEQADKLTTPPIEKPSCVKTYSGFTTFQLAYFILAAVAAMWARGNSTNGRIMAFWLIVIMVVSWLVGLVFSKDCSTTVPGERL